jgi:hypothetical protein
MEANLDADIKTNDQVKILGLKMCCNPSFEAFVVMVVAP